MYEMSERLRRLRASQNENDTYGDEDDNSSGEYQVSERLKGLLSKDEETKKENPQASSYQMSDRLKGLLGRIDQDYISRYVSDSDTFLQGSVGRLNGMGYSDMMSGNWKTSYRAERDDLVSRGKAIRSFLQANRGSLNEKGTANLLSYLDQAEHSYRMVNSAYDDRYSYFAQFGSQEEYDAAVKQWKDRQAMLDYDAASGGEEISALTERIAAIEAAKKGYIDDWNSMPRPGVEYPQYEAAVKGYDDQIAELKKQKSQKEQYHNDAQQYKKTYELTQYYSDFANAEDFSEKSKYVPQEEKKQRAIDIMLDNYSDNAAPWDYPLYEHVNGNKDATAWISEQAANYYGADGGAINKIWGRTTKDKRESLQMTPEEVSIFNYLYATQGMAAANEYYGFLEDDLNLRQRVADDIAWREYASESPVSASVFSTIISPMKGLGYLEQLGDYLGDGKLEPNAPYNRISYTQASIRGQVAQEIEESGKWGKLGSFAYQTGMSMGDFLLNTALAGNNQAFVLSIMGTGAAADGVIAAKDRGLSDDQSFALGTIAGIAEAAMESINMETIFSPDMLKDGITKFLLKNAASEGLEEVGTDVVNLFADILTSKDQSEWQTSIDSYIAQGMSYSEAVGKAICDQALQMGADFLGGAVSGAFMSGTTAGINMGLENAGYYRSGIDIMEAQGGTDALMNLANEVAGVSSPDMQKAIAKQSRKVERKATARKVGKLYDTVLNASNQANASANQADIAKSLKQRGFSQDAANDIAEAVVAGYNGQELTDTQTKLLKAVKKNSVAMDAISQIMDNPNSTVGQRSRNVRAFQDGVARGNVAPAAGESMDSVKRMVKGENLATKAEKVAENRAETGNTDGSTTLAETGETVKVTGISAKEGNALSYTLDNGKTATGKELALSENDALLANALGEMDIGAEDANAIWRGYDGTASMEDYAAGVRLAYEYGYQGLEYSRIDSRAFGKGIADTTKKLAYNLGKKAIALGKSPAYNGSTNTKEGVNNGRGETVHLRYGTQRSDGADSGRQIRGLEETPGGVQEREAEGRPEGSGRSPEKAEGRVNSGDLGVPGGIGGKSLTKVDGIYSADVKQAIAEGARNGLEVVCFTGGNLEIEGVGAVRAAISGKKVFVRADHPEFTAQQLLRHEMAHREFGHAGENINGKADVRKVYDRLVERCGGSEEPVKNIIAMYSEAFDMGYDAETGTDSLAMEVFTEIVCDSQADMNAFAPEDRADTEGFMQEIRRIAQEEKAQIQGRAPPYNETTKHSKESRKVTTFLRHYTGEVRECEYIYLSNIEKATIKSNIKTGFTHITPDAKRGIVSAHALNKGYTYHFVCNADYSVTVIDVLDNVADRMRIDRLLMEVIGDDRAGFRQTGRPIHKEGHGSIYSRTNGNTYEKTQQGKSTTELDGRTPESDWQRDSGAGRENRTNGGTDTSRQPEKVKFSREFVSKQMSEQEQLLRKANKALEKSNAQLQEDNQYLKQLLKLQRQVTGGTKFTKTSVEAAAKSLMKNAGAKGDIKELSGLLNDFYEYVATGKELTWEDVMSHAHPVVDWLNRNRQERFVREAYAQEVLDVMKGRSFYLDESQKAEAAHAYGSYQNFRKTMFGTITVSDNAKMSLDNFWKEMSENHPLYFPEGTVSGDQVAGIVDALDRLKTAAETSNEFLDGYTDEMRERELLHDVYDSFWKVSTLRTVADAKQREINNLKSKHYATMDRVRSEHKQAMTDLAAEYGKRMKELRKAYRERTAKKGARVKGRNTVEKQAKTLMKVLANPTKDAHVPSELQKPLEEFLESIDFTSKQLARGGDATIRDIAYTRALTDVRTAIASQRNAIEGVSDGTFKLDIPASFLEEIDQHIKSIVDATKNLDLTTNRVYDMSGDELAGLGHILTVINKTIRDIDRLHMAGAKARVSDLALDTQREMRQRKPVKGDSGNTAMWASYTPWYAFRRMGTAAQQVFHGLMQGQAKLARTADSVIKFAQKTYTDKEVKGWEKKVHTIHLESGGSIKMTTAQIMSFYCLSKREQGEGHMMGGGIRIGTIKPGSGKEVVQKEHHTLTVMDIAAINGTLDSRAKKVADELQQYMERTGGRLINEISKARWDYAAATEVGYFPIKTDDATRDVKDPGQEKANLWALLNKSFTKAITPGANNAMIVDSIFDVFADHMSQVAEYNAFALPLVDAMKWFNYRDRIKLDDGHIKDVGVQRAIRDTLGTSAVKYFVDLMTDINSSQKAGRHENMAGRILSRRKVAAVGFNLRVAIQQPTAILRASLILDAPELVKGTVRIGTRKLVKEMQEYSGIALWKSMGYYDLNISRGLQEQIKGDKSLLDKANDVGTWLPGKMDEWTWARIWAACKTKATKETKLTGEALLQETARIFEDVVYQTQVADSVLTRSSLMRSKGQFMKEATAFMAEPTVSLNILLSAFQDYEQGHTTWEKTKRGLMIGFCGYALPSVINALVTALADAWRDDDEYEDFGEKFNQALFGESITDGNLFSELNPLEKIPFIKDGLSLLKGYSVAPGYADLIQSGIDLADDYKKILSGKGSKTEYGVLYQTLDVLGSMVGFSAAPALREVAGIWNHTIGKMYPGMKLVRYEDNKNKSIRDAYHRGYLSGEEAIRELVAAKVADSEREAGQMVGKWKYESDYPKLSEEITYTQYSRWETEGKPKGVTLDLFVKVAKFRDDGTSNSVKSQDEVKQYIESVARNNRTRHALWCCFYKASTSPWK